VAQYPQPTAGLRDQRILAVQLLQAVLAVAEEREVAVGQPAQQADGLGDVVGGHAGRGLLLELVGDRRRRLAHPRPVLDRDPHVLEHAAQPRGDLLERRGVGLAVDLDVDPGLDERVTRPGRDVRVVRRPVEHLEQVPGDVAAHDHLRVDDDVDAAVLPRELGVDRVDQERHVVGDDLDDGVARRPAVLVHRRGVDADRRRALRPRHRELAVRHRQAREVHRLPLAEVLDRHVVEVALHEHRQAAVGGPAALGCRDGEPHQVTAARGTRCPQGSSGHLGLHADDGRPGARRYAPADVTIPLDEWAARLPRPRLGRSGEVRTGL
jgi:hypothetical protein